MTVELNTTGYKFTALDSDQSSSPSHDFIASEEVYDKVHQFSKKINKNPPTVPVNNLVNDWRQPEKHADHDALVEAEKFTQISASDFEILIKSDQLSSLDGNLDRFLPDVKAAKGAIVGTAAHTITNIITELMREVQEKGTATTITNSQDSLKEHEKALMENVAKKVLDKYGIVHLKDTPYVAADIWKLLRKEYIFVKKTPNSKHTPLWGGDLYSPEWVAAQWNSREQRISETKLFELHSKKIEAYINDDLFERSAIMLPLETDPRYKLQTEMPLINFVDHGSFKTQYKGQADWVVEAKTSEAKFKVVIDQKYQKPEHLFNLASRLQVLCYTLSVKHNFGKRNIEYINPQGVMFLYEVYDLNSDPPASYYVDASILPNEFPSLAQAFWQYSLKWWVWKDEFRKIHHENKIALVAPHLPSPDELTRLANGHISPPPRLRS